MKFIKNTTGTIGAIVYKGDRGGNKEVHIGCSSEGKEELLKALEKVYEKEFGETTIPKGTLKKFYKTIDPQL